MNDKLTEIEGLKQKALTIINNEESSRLKSDSLIELINFEILRNIDFDSFINDIEKKDICVDFLKFGYDLWLTFIIKFWVKVNDILKYYVSENKKKTYEIVYEIADKRLYLEKHILIIDNFMNRKGFSVVQQNHKSEKNNNNSNDIYFNLRGFWYDDKDRKVKIINEHVNFIVHQFIDNKESFIYNEEHNEDNEKILERFRTSVNKLLNRFELKLYSRPDENDNSNTIYYTNYNNKEVTITTDIDLNFLFSFIVFSKQNEKLKG